MRGLQEKTKYSLLLVLILIATALSLFISSKIHRPEPDRAITENQAPVKFRLEEIRERGKLIAITSYNPTDYFVYRGEPMGYQFEKLKMFADYLGVDLEVKVAKTIPEAIHMVNSGDGDLIAMGLTVNHDRKKKLSFTEPFLSTRQMLVQHKPANWRKMQTYEDIERALVRNPLELGTKTVYVQKGSAYRQNLENLASQTGEEIKVVEDPNLSTDQLIDLVSQGRIEYTICDEYMAELYEKIYPDVDIRTPVSFPQNIAWAVKKNSDSLRMAINYWQEGFSEDLVSTYLFEKYFVSTRSATMARSEYSSSNGGKLSPYDDLIRSISGKYDLDWLLMASLIYQESQFKADVVSSKGAFGLMQMMPGTARLFGIDTTSTPADQIEAGIRYLRRLDAELPKEISDPQERMKFILAAYNVGIAHVFDARRLAEKNGMDPNTWTGSVDYFILHKSNPDIYQDSVVRYGYARGNETYNFVREVLDRYAHYKNILED